MHGQIVKFWSVSLFGWLGCVSRLFSCGTSKDGESHIVEWNESEGAVKRTYQGFRKRSLGVVQFDTTKNRFLAAGDDFSIKFWDMDNVQLLTSIEADGNLPVSLFFNCQFEKNILLFVLRSLVECCFKSLIKGKPTYPL